MIPKTCSINKYCNRTEDTVKTKTKCSTTCNLVQPKTAGRTNTEWTRRKMFTSKCSFCSSRTNPPPDNNRALKRNLLFLNASTALILASHCFYEHVPSITPRETDRIWQDHLGTKTTHKLHFVVLEKVLMSRGAGSSKVQWDLHTRGTVKQWTLAWATVTGMCGWHKQQLKGTWSQSEIS